MLQSFLVDAEAPALFQGTIQPFGTLWTPSPAVGSGTLGFLEEE